MQEKLENWLFWYIVQRSSVPSVHPSKVSFERNLSSYFFSSGERLIQSLQPDDAVQKGGMVQKNIYLLIQYVVVKLPAC